MGPVTLPAPAKLNLRLLVGPRRPDGYHEVSSLMVTLAGLEDTITIRPARARSVHCPGIDGDGNLAWRALDALERRARRRLPCAVSIEKRIPVRAGLGGGSSDAAATLLGANRMFDLGLDAATLEAAAAEVGSDVPFFVRGGVQWARGRGERLTPARAPAFAAVIVKPPFGLSTGDVYRAFDALPPPAPAADDPAPSTGSELARWVRNDLWPAAISLQPGLSAIAGDLGAAGAAGTVLCGSGSAVAGVFPDRAAARAAATRLDHVVAVVSAG